MNRDIIAFTKYKFNVYGNKDIRSGKDSAVVGIVGKSKSLDFPTMLIFWSLVRNSVVLAVYLLFSVACFLTVHEHYDKVWGEISAGNEKDTVGFHIRNLRKKLCDTNSHFSIDSVREIGYRFNSHLNP